jgi:hypothetical protein
MKRTRWPGNWKVTCHVCGMWFPSGEIQKRWDGLFVCPKDFETRHPQTLIKIKGERNFPSFVSKDSNPDNFALVCGIDGSSGYVDLGTVDCMRLENTKYTYAFLADLTTNGHELVSSIPVSTSLYADDYADDYA